jgi:hypothetical protein
MNQATPTHIRLPGVCCDGMNEPLDTREAGLRLGQDGTIPGFTVHWPIASQTGNPIHQLQEGFHAPGRVCL